MNTTRLVDELCKSLREEPERWKGNGSYNIMRRDDGLELWPWTSDIWMPYQMSVGFWNRLKLMRAIRDCKAINLIRLAQKRLKP